MPQRDDEAFRSKWGRRLSSWGPTILVALGTAAIFSTVLYLTTPSDKEVKEKETKEKVEKAVAKKIGHPEADVDEWDSGTHSVNLSMSNADLGLIEVVDGPGDSDFMTMCFHGKRVWSDLSEGDGIAITEDPNCEKEPAK